MVWPDACALDRPILPYFPWQPYITTLPLELFSIISYPMSSGSNHFIQYHLQLHFIRAKCSLQSSPKLIFLFRWFAVWPLDIGNSLKYDLQIWIKVSYAVNVFVQDRYNAVAHFKHMVLGYLVNEDKNTALFLLNYAY